MKIAIISEGFFPEVNGVNYCIYYHLNFFLAHKHEVLLIIPKYPKKATRTVEKTFSSLRDEVSKSVAVFEFDSIPLTSKRPIVRIPSISGYIQINDAIASFGPDLCIYHNPDRLIPHCNIPFMPPVISGLSVCKRRHIKIVALIHTMMPEYIDRATEWWLKPRIIKKILKRVWVNCYNKNFKTIYTVSENAHLKLIKLGIKTKIISGPFNGVDLKIFRNQPNLNFEQNNDLKITWIGRLTPEKNAHLLLPFIEALKKRINHFQFTIIGDGVLNKEISHHFKDDESVNLTGFISQKEISNYLRKSDLYITLSDTEAGCLTIREALATETPVIAPESNKLSIDPTKPVGIFFDESFLSINKLEQLADTIADNLSLLDLWRGNIREIIPLLDWNYTITEFAKTIELNTGLKLISSADTFRLVK